MKKILFLFALFPLLTAEPIIVNTGHAEVSLIKNSKNLQSKDLYIGIKFDLQKNWHTYWKNPGDSGGPLEIKWSLPEGIKLGNINWPSPELIPYPPLMTYGYNDQVVFPFKVTGFELGSQNKKLELVIDFLICADVCIPEKAFISSTLNEIQYDSLLDQYIKEVPKVTLPTLINQINDELEIKFSKTDKRIEKIYFFSDIENTINHAEDQKLLEEENNYVLKIKLLDEKNILKKISGVIAMDGEVFLIDSDVINQPDEGLFTQINLFQAIIFAFIGGLILNLMPCVFPVISLKVLSFVSMGGESSSKIRMHSLSFSIGVLASFILIALILIGLRESGNYLGWGFQLQSPIIVSLLAIVMFIIGLVLLLDFNIGSSLTRSDLNKKSYSGYINSFLTGILAVVVASPCTAPFMGAAIGYALVQPSGTTLPIFASLGFGFAFPYLALSANPKLISIMPRPGKWMELLKEFFAFPMFATSLWLIWVFSFQSSSDQLIVLLLCMLIVSLLFWIYKTFKSRLIIGFTFFISIFYIILQISSFSNYDKEYSQLKESSAEKIWYIGIESDFQKTEQAYLINYTAAWCITCQANDKIALSRPKVKEYLKSNNITYVVADWTNKDSDILQSLTKYGRNGVPLYIFWAPGMKNPSILPAILTENLLLENLKN